MNTYLITPTLIQSWQYWYNYDGDNEEEVKSSFLKTLKREKTPTNEAMQAGIDFENDIYSIAKLPVATFEDLGKLFFQKTGTPFMQRSMEDILDWFKNQIECICNDDDTLSIADIKKSTNYILCIKNIFNIVKNGMWQIALKKEIKVANTNFLLYGKADVIKEDTIFDIKFTTNASNYNIGKYSNSVQHLLYMFCAELNKFQYIISDGNSYWLEDYNLSDTQIHSALSEKISNFYSFLQNNQELLNIFQEKWKT